MTSRQSPVCFSPGIPATVVVRLVRFSVYRLNGFSNRLGVLSCCRGATTKHHLEIGGIPLHGDGHRRHLSLYGDRHCRNRHLSTRHLSKAPPLGSRYTRGFQTKGDEHFSGATDRQDLVGLESRSRCPGCDSEVVPQFRPSLVILISRSRRTDLEVQSRPWRFG